MDSPIEKGCSKQSSGSRVKIVQRLLYFWSVRKTILFVICSYVLMKNKGKTINFLAICHLSHFFRVSFGWGGPPDEDTKLLLDFVRSADTKGGQEMSTRIPIIRTFCATSVVLPLTNTNTNEIQTWIPFLWHVVGLPRTNTKRKEHEYGPMSWRQHNTLLMRNLLEFQDIKDQLILAKK